MREREPRLSEVGSLLETRDELVLVGIATESSRTVHGGVQKIP